MLYSLPHGGVIELSTEQYFLLTDEDLDYLNGIFSGEVINDPFYKSVIKDNPYDPIDSDDLLESIEEYTPDLTEIAECEKFLDRDFFQDE